MPEYSIDRSSKAIESLHSVNSDFFILNPFFTSHIIWEIHDCNSENPFSGNRLGPTVLYATRIMKLKGRSFKRNEPGYVKLIPENSTTLEYAFHTIWHRRRRCMARFQSHPRIWWSRSQHCQKSPSRRHQRRRIWVHQNEAQNSSRSHRLRPRRGGNSIERKKLNWKWTRPIGCFSHFSHFPE